MHPHNHIIAPALPSLPTRIALVLYPALSEVMSFMWGGGGSGGGGCRVEGIERGRVGGDECGGEEGKRTCKKDFSHPRFRHHSN